MTVRRDGGEKGWKPASERSEDPQKWKPSLTPNSLVTLTGS
jgi:hypothetical protein